MICEPGDVVVVPFPFSDIPVAKARPAVVISAAEANDRDGATVLAMVTTAAGGRRPGDIPLSHLAEAGLRTPCVVRMKLFTLDNRLISRRIGMLIAEDRQSASKAIRDLIAL